jgi:hypothetical protein
LEEDFAEVSGKEVKEVIRTPGGAPAKIDPNGNYLVESMYVQHVASPSESKSESSVSFCGTVAV